MSHPAKPRVDRPAIADPTYGIPRDRDGLLSWEAVLERLSHAKVYWVSTIDPKGRPHATPVDGVWRGDTLYFSGSPTTRRVRNLMANPAACIHLESGSEVVILHGEAQPVQADDDFAGWLARSSEEKYGYGLRPEDYQVNAVHAFRTSVAFAWSRFPKDVTRFTFEA